jgi:hypothetical protein
VLQSDAKGSNALVLGLWSRYLRRMMDDVFAEENITYVIGDLSSNVDVLLTLDTMNDDVIVSSLT